MTASVKEQTETFLTSYKNARAHELAECIPLDANDVALKILATSPPLIDELKKKTHGGQIIPCHSDAQKTDELRKHDPQLYVGKMDEKFITFGWQRDKDPTVILFAFTLPLLDPQTGLLTACRILRASDVEQAHIVCVQWKQDYIQQHEELDGELFISMEEYETLSCELGLQRIEITEHNDFFVARMEFPKLQFQDDWSSFAGDA